MTTLDEAFWRVVVLASLHCYQWTTTIKAEHLLARSHEHGINTAERMDDQSWENTVYAIGVIDEVIEEEKRCE